MGAEVGFVLHGAALADPVAEVVMGDVVAAGPFNFPERRKRSQASSRQLREVKRGGSVVGGTNSPLRGRAGTAASSLCALKGDIGTASATGVIKRAEDSTSTYAALAVRLVSVPAICS